MVMMESLDNSQTKPTTKATHTIIFIIKEPIILFRLLNPPSQFDIYLLNLLNPLNMLELLNLFKQGTLTLTNKPNALIVKKNAN